MPIISQKEIKTGINNAASKGFGKIVDARGEARVFDGDFIEFLNILNKV